MSEQTLVRLQLLDNYLPIIEGDYRNYCYYGGRGRGASHNIARALLIIAQQKRDRFLCTREVQKSIKDSVHKLLSDIINQNCLDTVFKITDENIINRYNGSEFIFKGLKTNEQDIKSIEGVGYAWVEEAQTVKKKSLDILVPTIRKPGSKLIYSFNRLTDIDPVFVKFCKNPDPDTYISKGTWRDNPFFPEVLKVEKDRDLKNNYNDYLHIWEGEPVVQSDKAILSRVEIQQAIDRTVSAEGAVIVGVDVARFGDDKSEMFKRKGHKIIDHREYSHADTHNLAGYIADFVNQDKTVPIKIDATGVGGGTCDTLRAWEYNVIDINFGSSPKDSDKYNNLISEAWFELKGLMPEIEIPNDEELKNQLATREWKIDSRGRRCVESKDDYKRKGYRSPDKADALIICFYTPSDNKPYYAFV